MGGLQRVEVTQADIDEIIRQRKRTGVGFSALLRGPRGEKPEGLASTTIANWLKGRAKTAFEGHTDWVITRYRSLPNKAKAQPDKPKTIPNPPLPDGFGEKLNIWRECGLLPTFLLQNATAAPNGFNRPILANWLSGISSTGQPEHVDFVSAFCERCIKEPDTQLPVTRPMRKALRDLWSAFDEQTRLSLPPRTVKKIDLLLTDMDAEIHPKDWQMLISELKKFK